MSDPIRNLAQFLALKKNADRKFVLMLGAGASISSGVKPTAEITGELVERFAAAEPGDVEARFDRLWSTATPETRESMLKPYLDQVPSRGYRPLAELIVKGFFDVVITFNFDRLLERALEDAGFHDYKVIIRGETDLAVIAPLVEAQGAARQDPQDARQPAVCRLLPVLERGDAELPGGDPRRAARASPGATSSSAATPSTICASSTAFNDAENAGSIYYVNPPGRRSRTSAASSSARRSKDRVISGDSGRFDDFFEALHCALTMPSRPPTATASAAEPVQVPRSLPGGAQGLVLRPPQADARRWSSGSTPIRRQCSSSTASRKSARPRSSAPG